MDKIDTARLLIRLGVGIVMLLFGLSQIKSPAKWLGYIPGFLKFIMPIRPTSFMRLHSLGNIVLGGLLVSSFWQPVSIWLALIWWGTILPFAFYYGYTTGLRDFAIIMALVSLLLLS